MDFDKLKTFYHVATIGSITKATDILQMDKSSISRQLTLLEEQVGNKLFERKSNQLFLTAQGQFLLEKARIILLEIEATKAIMLSKGEQLTGSLTITTTHALASTWLTHFIHQFIEQHPLVQIFIKASNQPLNLSMREADVALRPYCNDQPDLIQKHLMTWRLYLHASRSYLEKFGTPLCLEDLDHHRLIIFGEDPLFYPYNYSNWPLHIGTKRGKIRKPFLLINSVEGMLNLVENGVGIGSMVEHSPLLTLSNADLVPVLLGEAYQDIDAYFIYHKQFEGIKLITSLEEFLINYVNNHEKFPESIPNKPKILSKKTHAKH